MNVYVVDGAFLDFYSLLSSVSCGSGPVSFVRSLSEYAVYPSIFDAFFDDRALGFRPIGPHASSSAAGAFATSVCIRHHGITVASFAHFIRALWRDSGA